MNCASCGGENAVVLTTSDYNTQFALCWECARERRINEKGFFGSVGYQVDDLWDKIDELAKAKRN